MLLVLLAYSEALNFKTRLFTAYEQALSLSFMKQDLESHQSKLVISYACISVR